MAECVYTQAADMLIVGLSSRIVFQPQFHLHFLLHLYVIHPGYLNQLFNLIILRLLDN